MAGCQDLSQSPENGSRHSDPEPTPTPGRTVILSRNPLKTGLGTPTLATTGGTIRSGCVAIP